MNQKQVKLLRGQIRQVVQELLPQVVTGELVASLAKELRREVSARLDIIDERQKDINGYIVRQSAGVRTPAAPQNKDMLDESK